MESDKGKDVELDSSSHETEAQPWRWRGVAWIAAVFAVLTAYGATAMDMVADPALVALVGRGEAIGEAFAYLLGWNIAALIGLFMGLRFWVRARSTPEYRFQAAAVILLSAVSGAVITWQCVASARAAVSL